MARERRPSVLIAEHQRLLREGITQLLEAHGVAAVAGQCADAASTLRWLTHRTPDILIVGDTLPGLNPIELLRRVAGLCPPATLILSSRSDRYAVLDALRAGARGFLLKTDAAACLCEAITHLLQGRVYISPQIPLIRVFTPPKPSKRRHSYSELGFRERQVFDMTVAGMRTKDIAAELDLSPKTVSTYRSKMMAKLGLADVPSLVRYAIRHRILEP